LRRRSSDGRTSDFAYGPRPVYSVDLTPSCLRKTYGVSPGHTPWTGMDPSEHRKIRNKALVLWGIFAPLFLVFSFSSGTSTSQDFSVLGVATVVTTLVVVGLPVTYVFVFASHWLGSRWRGLRRPSPLRGPPLGPSAAPSPFSYMGRRWRPIAGILTFVFALLAVSWLLRA